MAERKIKMSFWTGIKYALNSTLGKTGFKPLNELLEDKISNSEANIKNHLNNNVCAQTKRFTEAASGSFSTAETRTFTGSGRILVWVKQGVSPDYYAGVRVDNSGSFGIRVEANETSDVYEIYFEQSVALTIGSPYACTVYYVVQT